MPSVGLRRTTRVFGVVKRDGARVLRSGRRLWPDFDDGIKLRRLLEKDDLYSLMENDSNRNDQNNKLKTTATECESYRSPREEVNPKVLGSVGNLLGEIKCYSKKRKLVKAEAVDEMGKMFGTVYSRKRKRHNREIAMDSSDYRMYGIQYSRRRKRRIIDSVCLPALVVVIDPSLGMDGLFEQVLFLVLGYMREARLRKSQLAEFLPQKITRLYSNKGFRFSLDAPANTKGVWKFFGAKKLMPLFSVDYSAVPLCYMYMHRALLIGMMLRSFDFVNKSFLWLSNGREEFQPIEESKTHDENGIFHTREPCHNSFRNVQHRDGLHAHSFRKRRSSLQRRRAKSISIGLQKVISVTSKKSDSPFISFTSRKKTRTSLRLNSSTNINEMNSAELELNQDLDSLCCSANILVFKSDRCCREEGVSIMLELSSSREWLLVVKKDGTIRYTHKAESLMKPCSSNRLTHAIFWTGDDTWKLEFFNKQDWSIFKELYKECANRNLSAPSVKVIPIPGLSEVSEYKDDGSAPFRRPLSYISVEGDEVSRVLAKTTASYDMDSEDEEWLKTFNNEAYEQLSEEKFELMVDGFEKSIFISPDEFCQEKAASSLGHLGSKEGLEAVYRYWMTKRKHRKAPLIRIFQGHHAAKKALVVSKPLFRRRRSFKRQASQLFGRGKQPSILQAMAAEQTVSGEHNTTYKVDKAQAAASRCVEAAIAKRRKAQILMENADLAMYKAVMALRIAEVAVVAESSEAAASQFLNRSPSDCGSW